MTTGDPSTKRLRVGLLSPIHDIDPHAGGQELGSSLLFTQVYQSPYAADEGGARPQLFAQPLGRHPDAGDGVVSASVRPGVRFSDGTELDAETIASSLRASGRLAGIARVETDDDRVVFHLVGDVSVKQLESVLASSPVARETGGRFLGTGPYRVAEGSSPDQTRLVANPHFEPEPDIDEVVLVTYPTDDAGKPEALLQAFENDQVDFTSALSREDIGRLRMVRKWFEPGSGTALLYLNTERLTDPELRRGLAMAIDRAELARASYPNPMAFTATGLLPPMLGSMRDGLAHDPKQAGLLVGRASARPDRLVMLVIWGPRPYLPHPLQSARAIAESLDALGLQVDIQQARNADDYFARIARGDYDLALSGWVADTVDSADFFASLLSPEAIPSSDKRIVTEGNLSHWRDDRMAAALARYRDEPTEPNKQAIQEILTQETPLVPLMYGPTIFVYTPRVVSFKPSPLGIPVFADMEML